MEKFWRETFFQKKFFQAKGGFGLVTKLQNLTTFQKIKCTENNNFFILTFLDNFGTTMEIIPIMKTFIFLLLIMSKPWILYCIVTPDRSRSYVGVTVNLKRRLRQHRGELKGGAKSTRGHHDWVLFYAIRGFPDKRTVLQWEWRLHRLGKQKSSRGLHCTGCRRLDAFKKVRAMERVCKKAIPNTELSLRIHYHRATKICCLHKYQT